MKTLLTAAAIIVSLGAALPAAAQTFGQSERTIETRIDRGVRDGSLTRTEARSLSRQLEDVQRLERQYARGGINTREARTLDQRYAQIEQRLRAERHDRDHQFGAGYGRGFDGYR